ncbi:BlaI/MecI/CopY family transcriptional regulator [Desulfosporosinus sp. FKA]|uniref:BlaI/MecI/CopY family transcriptional regulator n=1 Tax=Desulfosporosinus sp. FKA TaxID=1969834 RepID=UPI000B49E8D3|nr:BlaI/MecI/CopY family transcriptional regulator [Desulfosporosinus sp. FKA]
MKKTIKITDAEWEVMKLLWEKSPITSSEMIKILGSTIGWSPTTIYTLISRLVKKKALVIDQGSSPYICRPLLSQSDYRKEERTSFLKKVYNGSLNLFIKNLLEEEELSEAEIDELKTLLDIAKNKER